jgi:hypothetical protein
MRTLFITCTAIILVFTFSACNEKQPESKKETNFTALKNAVISYMSQPDFTNPGFTQQATGTNAELQVYDMDENMLYFSAVKNDFDKIEVLGKLTEVPEKVEFGFEQNGKSILGAYTLAGLHRYFFRFPKNDFKIDSTRMISVDFENYKYTVSLKELADFANNVSVHGGSVDTNTGGNIYLANHGAFVSKQNEPSLKRLTMQITGSETGKEKISQQLLDFVTGSLKFNNYEATGEYEVLKRPNEVLMTGGSDCSGLTILYASLLEQYGIGYILVYFKGHICAAVEGDYPVANGLNIMYEGKKYTLAETTVKGFIAGVTPLDKSFPLEGITYIQKPGTDMVKYKTDK